MIINGFGAMPQEEVAIATPVVTEVRNENQFLDFEKNTVQVLTLEELERTNLENRGDNRDCPHGIYHYALIQQILEMAAQHGYDAEVYDLFATNNRDKQTPGVSLYPELEKKYGERAVQAHTLRRIYANIRLRNFDNDALTTNIALSYTQKGIQVGFGTMVKVCHNQNIMGEGQFVSDYSVNGMNYAKGDKVKTDLAGIMKVIGGWLTDAEHIFITETDTIERMKNAVLTAEQIYTILGMLLAIRVQSDTQIKEIYVRNRTYPLNQSQITKFTEGLLVHQKKHGRISAWDMYNCATELYKPQIVDQNMILPQTMAMMTFLRNQQIFV